jgi:DNA repair protein RadC
MEDLTNLDIGMVAEIQLSYQPKVKPSERPHVRTPGDIYRVFCNTWDCRTFEFVEQFKVMLLNRANRVIGICTLSTGSATFTIADPKLVFAVALKANATSIVLSHNHPSGNLTPSRQDIELTRNMAEVGRLLDLKVIDHLIVCTEGYYSFAEEGAL